jgi:hypothetical protein
MLHTRRLTYDLKGLTYTGFLQYRKWRMCVWTLFMPRSKFTEVLHFSKICGEESSDSGQYRHIYSNNCDWRHQNFLYVILYVHVCVCGCHLLQHSRQTFANTRKINQTDIQQANIVQYNSGRFFFQRIVFVLFFIVRRCSRLSLC